MRPGQPLSLSAAQLNWINQQMRGAPRSAAGPQNAAFAPPYTAVMARNDTNRDVPRYGVLMIQGASVAGSVLDIGPSAGPQFAEMPILRTNWTAWSDPIEPWGVAVQPIKDRQCGLIAVAGVVQARVNVRHEADTTCGPTDAGDSRVALRSGNLGAQILWKEPGVGDGKWALIRFESGEGRVRAGLAYGGRTFLRGVQTVYQADSLVPVNTLPNPREFAVHNITRDVPMNAEKWHVVLFARLGGLDVMVDAESS